MKRTQPKSSQIVDVESIRIGLTRNISALQTRTSDMMDSQYYSPADITIYPLVDMMVIKPPIIELGTERVAELWGRREDWEVAELGSGSPRRIERL